jgi:hypothetical protein
MYRSCCCPAQTGWPDWANFRPLGAWLLRTGVDVVITIFCDFWQFSAKKFAFFSKTNVMIKILHNLALFGVKNANLLQFFSAKIFKIHNIGPSFFWQLWSSPHKWATFSTALHNYDNNGLGYTLGDFFDKLIWSPCQPKVCFYHEVVSFWAAPWGSHLMSRLEAALKKSRRPSPPWSRVARFFLVRHTRGGEYTKLPANIRNFHKTYLITAKYTKLPQNIPNYRKIYQITTKYTKRPYVQLATR